MQRLLVAVDGSDGSQAAVEESLTLAADLGASVTFVYVRKSPHRLLGSPFYERALHGELNRANRAVQNAIEAAELAGVAAEGEILEGDPADEIVSLADNRGAELIVIGSRGFGALAGAVLGSVSRAVVQHAPCPVLVAKQVPTQHRQVA